MMKSTLQEDSVRVRPEDPTSSTERVNIRAVHEAAFGRSEEADIVDKLRSGEALVSLLAESAQGIVGHVLFSRMWIRTPSTQVPAVALAPVAVLPEHQRKGIWPTPHRAGAGGVEEPG